MDRASVRIEAAPAAVWDVVTDIAGFGRFSPENTGGRWTGGQPLTVGATFTGGNRHGLIRWTTHCTVVDVVAGQRFSFEVDESKARWTYLVEPSGTGTRVTETREMLPGSIPRSLASGDLRAGPQSWPFQSAASHSVAS